ncbi:hypothetical protein B0H14DRAFT_3877425 [Mycena olivaceomarginata]|nr:hypothetical protein B0H14DRAFT_3877425 [Mycena olivaceomarginata]
MFGGTSTNPYDEIVVKTTDETLTSENWELILNLCDKVQDEGQEGAHNVVAALLKRLTHRNPNVQLYALSLAEALGKNCSIELHRELASRAWTQGLERVITDREGRGGEGAAHDPEPGCGVLWLACDSALLPPPVLSAFARIDAGAGSGLGICGAQYCGRATSGPIDAAARYFDALGGIWTGTWDLWSLAYCGRLPSQVSVCTSASFCDGRLAEIFVIPPTPTPTRLAPRGALRSILRGSDIAPPDGSHPGVVSALRLVASELAFLFSILFYTILSVRPALGRGHLGGVGGVVSSLNTHDRVRTRALALVAQWTADFAEDSTLGLMGECYEGLRAKNYKYTRPDTPPPPAADDAIRRREEEELQRVLEMSVRDRGGRVPYAFELDSGSGSAAAGGSSSAAAGASAAGAGSSSVGVGYAGGYSPAPAAAERERSPSPVAASAGAGNGANAAATNGIVTRVRALHPFAPTEAGELGFEKGDVIKVVDRGYKDWWRGQLRGRTGIFPVNYVEPLPEPTPAELAAEASQEAAVFAQAVNVERLLNMLRALDPAKGDNLADDEEIQGGGREEGMGGGLGGNGVPDPAHTPHLNPEGVRIGTVDGDDDGKTATRRGPGAVGRRRSRHVCGVEAEMGLSHILTPDAIGVSVLTELYRSCMALRPKIVKLIDKYSQKRADLVSMNETFVRARTIFDRMMEESLARHGGAPYYQQPQPQPGGGAWGGYPDAAAYAYAQAQAQQAGPQQGAQGQGQGYGVYGAQGPVPYPTQAQQQQQAQGPTPYPAQGQPQQGQGPTPYPAQQQQGPTPYPSQQQQPEPYQAQGPTPYPAQAAATPYQQPQPAQQAQAQPAAQQQQPQPAAAAAAAQPQQQQPAQQQQQPAAQAQQAQPDQTAGPPYVYDPHTTYADPNVQAWAQYYAAGGKDLAGSVYFVSIPGVTDGAPAAAQDGAAEQQAAAQAAAAAQAQQQQQAQAAAAAQQQAQAQAQAAAVAQQQAQAAAAAAALQQQQEQQAAALAQQQQQQQQAQHRASLPPTSPIDDDPGYFPDPYANQPEYASAPTTHPQAAYQQPPLSPVGGGSGSELAHALGQYQGYSLADPWRGAAAAAAAAAEAGI